MLSSTAPSTVKQEKEQGSMHQLLTAKKIPFAVVDGANADKNISSGLAS